MWQERNSIQFRIRASSWSRIERRAEENSLAAPKTKLQEKLVSSQLTLFAAHADGRVNSAKSSLPYVRKSQSP